MADTPQSGTPRENREPNQSAGKDRCAALYEIFTLERRLEKLDAEHYGISPATPIGQRYQTGTRSDPKKNVSTGKIIAMGLGLCLLNVGMWWVWIELVTFLAKF